MDRINGIGTELYMFILENDSVEKATFIDSIVHVINSIDDLPNTPIKMDLSYFNVIPQTIFDTIQNNIGTELSNGEIINIMLSTYTSSVIEILKSTGIYINSEVENSLLLDILNSIYCLLDVEYELKDKYVEQLDINDINNVTLLTKVITDFSTRGEVELYENIEDVDDELFSNIIKYLRDKKEL